MQSFTFTRPSSLPETLALMAEHLGHCKVVAGGTDVVPALREGRLPGVSVLIDVRRLPELHGLKITECGLWLGGGTTFAEILQSAEVGSAWGLLAEAGRRLGSRQVRNLATVAGNVANASAAADSIPALLALDAQVTLVSWQGRREVPLETYLEEKTGAGAPADELLLGFSLPRPRSGTRSRFAKVARRQALAIARLSLAVVVHAENGLIDRVRLVPGAVLPCARHLVNVERVLTGSRLTPEVRHRAAKLASEEVLTLSGWRASFTYKLPLLEDLVQAMLEELEEELENGG